MSDRNRRGPLRRGERSGPLFFSRQPSAVQLRAEPDVESQVSTAIQRFSNAILGFSNAILDLSNAILGFSIAIPKLSIALLRLSNAILDLSIALLNLSIVLLKLSKAILKPSIALLSFSNAIPDAKISPAEGKFREFSRRNSARRVGGGGLYRVAIQVRSVPPAASVRALVS